MTKPGYLDLLDFNVAQTINGKRHIPQLAVSIICDTNYMYFNNFRQPDVGGFARLGVSKGRGILASIP